MSEIVGVGRKIRVRVRTSDAPQTYHLLKALALVMPSRVEVLEDGGEEIAEGLFTVEPDNFLPADVVAEDALGEVVEVED